MGRGNKGVKQELILACGRVDMYDMQHYAKEKLTLHHYPPFRETHHTVFDESFLLTRKNHDYIEQIERTDKEEYKRVMQLIKSNKHKLMGLG